MALRSVAPLFDRALACYAEAEAVRPPGNDDAILRWNGCVRTVRSLGGIEEETAVDLQGDHVSHRG